LPPKGFIERRQFAAQLSGLRIEASTLGLFRTMHAIDNALKIIGYEIADIATGKQADLSRIGINIETGVVKCKRHLRYKALRAPEGCTDCWSMFLNRKNSIEQAKKA